MFEEKPLSFLISGSETTRQQSVAVGVVHFQGEDVLVVLEQRPCTQINKSVPNKDNQTLYTCVE